MHDVVGERKEETNTVCLFFFFYSQYPVWRWQGGQKTHLLPNLDKEMLDSKVILSSFASLTPLFFFFFPFSILLLFKSRSHSMLLIY